MLTNSFFAKWMLLLFSLSPLISCGGGTSTTSSNVNSAAVAAPVFSPAAGTYSSTQSVTIATSTSGATIRYTIDGSTPTTSSTTYAGPISVSATTTINACAWKTGMNPSAMSMATYTIFTPTLTTIIVSPSTANVSAGSNQTFTAQAEDQYGNPMTGITFTWTSSNTSVGSINSIGLFTASSTTGNTTITATSGSVSGTASLTINQSSSSSFRFIAWADTKTGTAVLTSESPIANGLNPAFTVYSGDLCDSFSVGCVTGVWKTALNGGGTNSLFDKTFVTRGNHDSGDLAGWQSIFDFAATASSIGATNYSAQTADVTYSFDYGNSHFVGLDVPNGDVSTISSSQITWLDNDLTAAESRGLTHAFLFWHGPIYYVDGHSSTAPAALITALNKHSIVSAAFFGHEHLVTYTHIDSSRISTVTHPFEEFISGAAGADLYDATAGRYDYWLNDGTGSKDGFMAIDVSGNDFTVSVYNVNGTVDKTFSFSKNTFYVDQNASNSSDANSGTLDSPWKTIQKAANTAKAGETVYVRAGTYHEQVIAKNSGTSANYITFAAYPGEVATIDGTGLSIQFSDGLFDIAGKNYLIVDGFNFTNSPGMGVRMHENATNVIVRNNKFNSSFVYSAIMVGWDTISASNILIENNEINRTAPGTAYDWAEMISISGGNEVTVRNNHIIYNQVGEGIDFKDGSSNGHIYNNIVENTAAVGIYLDARGTMGNIEVYNNIVHTPSADAIALCNEEYYFAGVDGGGATLQNINIYNNIIYGSSSGLRIGAAYGSLGADRGTIKDVKVINNTFYNNADGMDLGSSASSDVQNTIIRNNIFRTTRLTVYNTANVTGTVTDHNMFDAGQCVGANCIIGDPKFVNPTGASPDFHLQSTSLAIDKGLATDAPATDLDGNSRSQGLGYDIGAYEYVP